MRAVRNGCWLLCIAMAAAPALAADKPFTGTFGGTGRACSGGLHIRANTIEWNSSFSVCKPTGYEVLEEDVSPGRRRIAYRLKVRSKHCRYAVVEVEHTSGPGWNVTGYQSLDAFQNLAAPGWKNSPLPERQVLSCPMVGPD
jgi:hypothetical protein